jgi:hypothetical protein
LEDKRKLFPVHATKAYRRKGVIAPLVLKSRHYMEESKQHYVPFLPPLYPQDITSMSIKYEAEWAVELVWTFSRREKSFAGNRTSDRQARSLVAIRQNEEAYNTTQYNHMAAQ